MDPLDPPSGEFRPAPVVAGSWRRSAVVISVVGALIVAAAVMTRANYPGLVAVPSSAADASPHAAAGPRLLPSKIACHGLDRATCLEVVAAALQGLPADAPEATSASAWQSLLCDSSIDCPPHELEIAVPRGSVVIDFIDGGPSAWLNVVERPAPSGAPVADAWIVRWQQAVAPTAVPPSPAGSGVPASPVAWSRATADGPAGPARGQGARG